MNENRPSTPTQDHPQYQQNRNSPSLRFPREAASPKLSQQSPGTDRQRSNTWGFSTPNNSPRHRNNSKNSPQKQGKGSNNYSPRSGQKKSPAIDLTKNVMENSKTDSKNMKNKEFDSPRKMANDFSAKANKFGKSAGDYVTNDVTSSLEDDIFEYQLIFPPESQGMNVTSQYEELKRIVAHNTKVLERRLNRIEENQIYIMWKCHETEQLSKKKKEQALARQQEYSKRVDTQAKENDVSTEKIEVVSPTDSSAEEEIEVQKKPNPTDNILPAMRQERAKSVAKRRQRPMSSAQVDLEYKKKEESSSFTPPRSSSPIIETAPAPETKPDPALVAEEETKKVESVKDDKVTKEPEPVYATLNKKKQKVEEKGEIVEDKEEQDKEEEEKESGEMMKDEDSKEETKEDDHDSSEVKEDKIELDLPEISTNTKKLEHVTKGRPRPARKAQRRPVTSHIETDDTVDSFFTASIETTNFDKVPTLAEEKKQAEKEVPAKRTPKKPMGMGMPGMPHLTPDMLKRKKKPSGDEKEEEKAPDSPKKSDDEKNGEDEEPKTPEPVVKRRPPGAMGLPGMGMGFGGNMLQEMKLKKLNKTKSPEPTHDKSEDSKNSSDHPPISFGRGMLKKTNPVTSPTSEKKEVNNNNNNNNNNNTTPNRWKSRSFESTERPEITLKLTGESSSKQNSSPPLKALKPPSLRGKPPPLPSKPKSVSLKPESDLRGGRPRPMSEFVDPKSVPFSVRLRATSWGIKDKSESTDTKK